MQTSLSLHRRVRTLPAMLGALLCLTSVTPTAFAAYTDVPSGAYYEDAAGNLLDLGALDSNETRLRPSDLATRAELVKLLVNLRQNQLVYPATSSFNDVSRSTWYFPYFEAAAKSGWVHGDGDCYQAFRPCYARPGGLVNRAEAATLLVRVFALGRNDLAPDFTDNAPGQWYYSNIQAAADHCVLQGDANTGLVRPAAFMNRAEMIVMFDRAYRNLQYGVDCGVRSTTSIQSVAALSPTRVRVTFSGDVNQASATTASKYAVKRTSDSSSADVRSVTWINARTVELTLDDNLAANTSYQLSVTNVNGTNGIAFSDTETFLLAGTAGHIGNVVALAPDRIRVTYDSDVNLPLARTASGYTIARVGGGQNIAVRSATIVDNRTVDLQLSSSLTNNTQYTVDALRMQTSAGVSFNDDFDFTYAPTATTSSFTVTPLSSVRLRLTFDADQNQTRAEETSRYTVYDGARNLTIQSARLTSARTVELTLDEALSTQRSYTVTARDLATTQGTTFTASGTTVFDTGNVAFKATLAGSNEVPPVNSTMTGTGTFTLTASGLQYDISVRGATSSGSMAITAAHFHLGAPGVSGPVLQPITMISSRAVGTWALTADQRNSLLSGNVYVNVHTTLHPDGEIRGQLFKQ